MIQNNMPLTTLKSQMGSLNNNLYRKIYRVVRIEKPSGDN